MVRRARRSLPAASTTSVRIVATPRAPRRASRRRADLGSGRRSVFAWPLASLALTRSSGECRVRPLAAAEAVEAGPMTVIVPPAETVQTSSHATVTRTVGAGGWTVEPESLTWGGVVSFGEE